MISKNRLKYLKSLKIKKYRLQEKQLLIEGPRLINESIKANISIEFIYYSEKFSNNHQNSNLINTFNNNEIQLVQTIQSNIDELSDSIKHISDTLMMVKIIN